MSCSMGGRGHEAVTLLGLFTIFFKTQSAQLHVTETMSTSSAVSDMSSSTNMHATSSTVRLEESSCAAPSCRGSADPVACPVAVGKTMRSTRVVQIWWIHVLLLELIHSLAHVSPS